MKSRTTKLKPDLGGAHYTSTLDAVKKIVVDEGLSGLYTGIGSSLLGVASTNFAYFYWYTVVREVYSSRKITGPTSAAIELALGAVAGALAQLFTIPVAVVATRQQTQGKNEKKGLIDTGKEVIGSDGLTGLWRGLKASLVLVVNPAITYGAYQRLREVLFPHKASLRPREAFGMSRVWRYVVVYLHLPVLPQYLERYRKLLLPSPLNRL